MLFKPLALYWTSFYAARSFTSTVTLRGRWCSLGRRLPDRHDFKLLEKMKCSCFFQRRWGSTLDSLAQWRSVSYHLWVSQHENDWLTHSAVCSLWYIVSVHTLQIRGFVHAIVRPLLLFDPTDLFFILYINSLIYIYMHTCLSCVQWQ